MTQCVYRIRKEFEFYIACSYHSRELRTHAWQYQSVSPGFTSGQDRPLEFCSLVYSCFGSAAVAIFIDISGFLGASNSDQLSAGMCFLTQAMKYVASSFAPLPDLFFFC